MHDCPPMHLGNTEMHANGYLLQHCIVFVCVIQTASVQRVVCLHDVTAIWKQPPHVSLLLRQCTAALRQKKKQKSCVLKLTSTTDNSGRSLIRAVVKWLTTGKRAFNIKSIL